MGFVTSHTQVLQHLRAVILVRDRLRFGHFEFSDIFYSLGLPGPTQINGPLTLSVHSRSHLGRFGFTSCGRAMII